MRFFKFTMIIVGIIIVLNMGGIVTPATGGLAKSLNLIDNNRTLTAYDVKSSALWSNDESTDAIPGVRYLLLGAVAAGIVLGAFGRTPDIRYITAGFVFFIGSFLLSDLIYIFTLATSFDGWIKWGIGVLSAGAIAGFIVTMLEFWQGND